MADAGLITVKSHEERGGKTGGSHGVTFKTLSNCTASTDHATRERKGKLFRIQESFTFRLI